MDKKLTRKDMKNDGILFFDTETTGVFDRRLNPTTDWMQFPHIVQISWVINSTEHDYIILPDGWDIPDQAAQIHGITTHRARAEGIPFVNAIYKFAESLSISNKIVAHNISFDIYMIVANVIRSLGEKYFENVIKDKILKERQFDTMKATTDFCKIPSPYGGYKWPQLSELYKMLFNEDFPAHNSLEDVKAMVRCFYELCDRKIFKI